MNTPPESVMTVKEVADYLRVNQRTVYRLAVERRLPGFKVGANWRFKRGDIDEAFWHQLGERKDRKATSGPSRSLGQRAVGVRGKQRTQVVRRVRP